MNQTTPTTTTDPDALPTGSTVVYHVAFNEHADAIQRDGIDNTVTREKYDTINTYLHRAADASDNIPPIADRAACAFAYDSHQRGTDPARHLSGYVTAAIDTTRLDAPAYVASYGDATRLYTTLTEECWPEAALDALPDPDPSTPEGTAYDAACDYWASLTPYDPAEPHGTGDATEVPIDGPVPADAITHLFDPRASQ